jgi:hypothetical protein
MLVDTTDRNLYEATNSGEDRCGILRVAIIRENQLRGGYIMIFGQGDPVISFDGPPCLPVCNIPTALCVSIITSHKTCQATERVCSHVLREGKASRYHVSALVRRLLQSFDFFPLLTPVTVSPERRKSGYSKEFAKPAVCHAAPSTKYD